MDIIINDANILIDLTHLNLVEEFVQLDLNLKTTDFVFAELNADQQAIFNQYIEDGKLEVIITEDEGVLNSIAEILNKTTGLSFEDCSVWYYAEKLKGILLSGDGKLRRQATASGISVKGILFVFDQLLLADLITLETAIEKIEMLYLKNTRLPIQPKEDRLISWTHRKHHN